MSKDDLEVPAEVPRKRRQLEQALDLWIAVWMTWDLPPSTMRRLQEEKYRRKQLARLQGLSVGLLEAPEGTTPLQLAALPDVLASLSPIEIHHGGVTSRVHQACKRTAAVVEHRGPAGHAREVVKASEALVAIVKETTAPPEKTGVWAMIGYAKHRSLPVKVILPNGELQGEMDG